MLADVGSQLVVLLVFEGGASPRPLQIEGELARAPFSPPLGGAGGGSTFKDQQYDKLAAHVRQHVDMDKLYQIISDHD